jgi:hypothetical protein
MLPVHSVAAGARMTELDRVDLVELLTVVDRFQLQSGLVVAPDFSLPDGWKPHSATVVIVAPDGKSRKTTASLLSAHFRIPDPTVSADRRWRLVVSLPTMTKDEVPIGSKIMVPKALKLEIGVED